MARFPVRQARPPGRRHAPRPLHGRTAGWLLITSSLPRLPASLSSLLLLVQPAVAMILAAVILGQRPTLVQVAGACLVCGGVLAAAR